MLVTIEGTVNSDVCAAGAVHTVEWTPHLRGLVRSGLVTVTDWNPAPATETAAVADDEPVAVEVEAKKPPRRPRASRRVTEE